MTELPEIPLPEHGTLPGNITHFARALRKAGLPIGPGRTVDAIRAVAAAGFTKRADFYWTLHACFVSRPEHRAVFQQIFRLYWRDPRYLEQMMAMLLPALRGVQEERRADSGEKRAAEALLDGVERDAPDLPEPGEREIEIDAALTMSSEERLRSLDFEQMSTAEMAEAKRILSRLTLKIRPLVSRRTRADPRGAGADWRATLHAALRHGGEIESVARRARRHHWPNLVVLCDISGSMSAYSRVVLHFVHTLANARGQGWARVYAFTFGTRLTNITRHMGARDVDAALGAAGAEAQDWEGGTRIGACLHAFNRDWARRVLGSGATVLLITDGLERDAPEQLAHEMERLHLSARRLIWVNPLLRWQKFAPKARGIAAMLPHVDCFRAGHNVASLEQLAAALSQGGDGGEKTRFMQRLASSEVPFASGA